MIWYRQESEVSIKHLFFSDRLGQTRASKWLNIICPSWLTESAEFRKCEKDETNQPPYGCDSVNSDTVTVNISGMTINAKSLMHFASLNLFVCSE